MNDTVRIILLTLLGINVLAWYMADRKRRNPDFPHPVYLYRKKDGKFSPSIGVVYTNSQSKNVLFKRVQGSKHKMRLPAPAWCIDSLLLYAAAQYNVNEIQILDSENGLLYTTSRKNFKRFANLIEHKNETPQFRLPLEFWQVLEKKK